MTDRFIDDYLLYLLARASEGASAQFHGRLRDHGLGVREWRVLAALSDGDGMTLGELAAVALQRQPTMSKIVDRMERDVLVRRRQGTEDRRQVRIFITPEGRRRVDAALRDAKRHEAEVLAGLTDADAGGLKTALRSLIAANDGEASRL